MAQVKTKEEIAKIRKACLITDQIYKKIIGNFKFKTELELCNFILKEIKVRNLRPSFPPIVVSGGRAGDEIHPKPTNEMLRGFVIIDFGVVYKRYMSDMTRTIFVGKPSSLDRTLYTRILNAKKKGEKVAKANVKCFLADKAARESLGNYRKYFIHTLGHGVGTRIHEAPRIYEKRIRPYFREGMVITIEPGIYIPGRLGIRIEDTYLVKKDSVEALTHSTQALVTIR